MLMRIRLVPDFDYSVKSHKFPVDVEISTEVPVEIYSRVNISAALLTKADGSDVAFGYVKRVTPATRQFFALLPHEPLCMRVDVLEYDEDFSEYEAGLYRCEIKVELGKKSGADVVFVELQDELVVSLT